MRAIVAPLVVLAVVGGVVTSPSVAAQKIPSDKAVITFTTKVGVTTFNHQLHATRAEKCESCHHAQEAKQPIQACHECHTHEGTDKAPKVKDALHLRCQGCHEENLKAGNPHGPIKKECKLCHIK